MKPLDPRLLAYARSARGYTMFLVATGLTLTVLTVVQCMGVSGAVSPLVDGEADLAGAFPALAAAAVAFAARAGVVYLQEAYGHRAALRTISDLRTQVLRTAGDRGQRWLSEGRTSSTVTLVTEALDDLEPYFVRFLPQFVLACLATPLTLLVILWLDWISAIAILVCIPLIPVFMVLVGRMTQSYAEGRLAAMQRLGDQLLDLLAGLTTLKALGREASPKRRVRELGDDYAAKTMNTLYVAFLSGAVLEFLATLSTALVAVEVGLRLANGDVSLFTGLTIIMLTPEALRPLREVGSQFHASSDGVSAARATFEILDGAARTSADGAEAPDLSSAVIEIRDVCVQAPGRATVAPSHLSARIEPGKVTVLRGPSGSGKSTAVSTLLGLLEPTGGRVTVGGVPMDAIDREALWRQISWVPQRPAIVPGTVLENVGFPPGPELRRAAALTGFDEVVARMPNGWDSRLGHAGVGLSVGQRQRLALTRALVAARPLVLLDEPSAHLDAISERHVSAAVRELADTGHTVVVVAHRNALIGEADAVVEVGAAAGGAAS